MPQLREPLYGKTLDELHEVAAEMSMPRFAAKQMAVWLYKKSVTDIAQITNLSLQHRETLAAKYEIGLSDPMSVAISTDRTKKYLFRTREGHFIESAYIPDRDRATLCVSSQAGCRMGCEFCATGKQGLAGQLSANEILNQIASLPERDTLTNVVYMGMGEPLDNVDNVLRSLEILTSEWGYAWSPSRVTLSTAGVLPNMKRFLDESSVHLAVSLHNPFPDQRAMIMPVERVWPIADVVGALKQYDFQRQRRVSFEYIVMSGINDSPAHIKEFARLLNGLRCRINLICFHKIPGSPYFSPTGGAMESFRDALVQKGITTTIRTSRGEDIQAACGLLSTAARK